MSAELQQIEQLKVQLTKLQAENAAKEQELIAIKTTTFDRAKCLIGNVDELAAELSPYVRDLDGDGKIDPITYTGVLAIIQITWDKFKENMLECYGKEIVVKLPGGFTGSLIQGALAILGLKL